MKKLFTLITLAIVTVNTFGMSYSEARQQALFLTDKMAYELNLNQEQYDYCYEINLDYLMGVVAADDVYGPALNYRNADMRAVLYDWQYELFLATEYFLRPLRWYAGSWVLPIYSIYDATRFFFGRPTVYVSYRGAHSRYHYSVGYYGSRRPHWNGGMRGHDIGPAHPHGHRGYTIGTPHGHRGYTIGSPRDHHGHSYSRPTSSRPSVPHTSARPEHHSGRGYSIGNGSHSSGSYSSGGHNSGYSIGNGTHSSGSYSSGGRSSGSHSGSSYSHPSSTRSMGSGSMSGGRSTGGGHSESHGGRGGSARGGR